MNEAPRQALVVDADDTVRRLTKAALSREGFDCHEAADGLAATRLSRQQSYHVVVTDLHPPDMKGHALAIELLRRRPRPLVVVFTAVVEPRLFEDLIGRGVADIVLKPMDFRVFASKIRVLADSHARQPSEIELPGDNQGEPGNTAPSEYLPIRTTSGSSDAFR